jgi:hypothetical protein
MFHTLHGLLINNLGRQLKTLNWNIIDEIHLSNAARLLFFSLISSVVRVVGHAARDFPTLRVGVHKHTPAFFNDHYSHGSRGCVLL